MTNFPMNDGVYLRILKVHRDKFIRSIERLLKEIKIQKEEMGWNKKRFKLLNKLERNYEDLLEFLEKNSKCKKLEEKAP